MNPTSDLKGRNVRQGALYLRNPHKVHLLLNITKFCSDWEMEPDVKLKQKTLSYLIQICNFANTVTTVQSSILT